MSPAGIPCRTVGVCSGPPTANPTLADNDAAVPQMRSGIFQRAAAALARGRFRETQRKPRQATADDGPGPADQWKCQERTGFAASREKVWAALNDPAVLKASIPGCQSLEKTSDTEMTATVQAKVGPVKATFNGHVTLSNIDPPNGYTIAGEGKGGVAGFAKGGADVKLSPDGDGTLLDLQGQRPGRRQARPDRRAADRRHRQADGRPVLHRFRRQCRWAVTGRTRGRRRRQRRDRGRRRRDRGPRSDRRGGRGASWRRPRAVVFSAGPTCGACSRWSS